MFFDVHTIDLRMPKTRKHDQIGERIIAAIKDNLALSNLVEHAKCGTVYKDTYQKYEPYLEFDLWQLPNKTTWKLTIRVLGNETIHPRVQGRLQQEMRQFVRQQSHLDELAFKHTGAYTISMTLIATLGDIAK